MSKVCLQIRRTRSWYDWRKICLKIYIVENCNYTLNLKQISSRQINVRSLFWFSLTQNPTFIIYSDFKQKQSLDTSIFQRFYTSFINKFQIIVELLFDFCSFFQNSIKTEKKFLTSLETPKSYRSFCWGPSFLSEGGWD